MSPAASASTNHARQGGVVGAGGGGGGSTDFTPAGVKRDSFSLVNLLHPEPPPPPPQPEHSQLASASLEDKIPLTNNNKKSSMQNMGVKIIHNLPTPTASPAPQPQPSSSSSSSSSSSTSLSAASSASSTISSSINVLNALVVCKEDLIGKDSILHHEPENDYMVIARDSEEQKDINNKNSIITTKCDGEDSMQKHKCRKCNVGFENASHLQQRNKEMHRFMTWECMYCHKSKC